MDALNWANIENAPVSQSPYPHFIVEDAIPTVLHDSLVSQFPKLPFPGLVPPKCLTYGEQFDALLKALDSQQLRDIIKAKLGIELTENPTLMTVRGHARQRDGRIHVDTPDKLVTILLYLNHDWVHEAGKLRVLNSNNMDDYVTEIPPLMGKMFVFKVTKDCWHGHLPLSAARRAIMINYMASPGALKKHEKKHTRSARFKKLKEKLLGA